MKISWYKACTYLSPSLSFSLTFLIRCYKIFPFSSPLFPFHRTLIDVSLAYALARQPLPSETRLRALFVILITRVMSLAALAACARAQTCFICELIYYANYFSECTPRESPTRVLVSCRSGVQTYFSCTEHFHHRVAVLSLLSVLLVHASFSCPLFNHATGLHREKVRTPRARTTKQKQTIDWSDCDALRVGFNFC